MSARDMINRIARYRACLWTEAPSEDDLRREIAESSAAAAFGKQGIAPLPESVLRLSEVLAHPDFKAGDAVAALEGDPALAIDVLRLANSPAFCGLVGCQTTAEAFNRLGAVRIKDLVVVSYLEELGAAMSGYSRIAFDHSVRVAQIARALPANATCTPERLYLCGLVHDIGTTLLDQSGEFTYYIGHYEDDEEQCAAERSALGFDHTTQGAVAAEMWKLPEPIAQVLVAHHNIEEAIGRPGDAGRMSACLVVAEELEHLSRDSDQLSEDVFDHVASSAAAQQLGLTAKTLQALWAEHIVGELHTAASAKSAA